MILRRNDDIGAADQSARIAAAAGYRLERLLGEGAQKVCYSAFSPADELVAFKILKPGAALERSQRELQAMLSCDHPNIAKCVASGAVTVGGSRFEYVVEECFTNGSLQDRVKSGHRLAGDEAFAIGDQLIGALGHLHDRSLVHRDIKPDNILVAPDGRPMLTDFGIVRALGETSLTATWQPNGPGTPSYMPAEQFHNEKSMINWRSDQFSLGVTIAVAALGIHPYGTDFRSQVESIAERRPSSADFRLAAAAARLSVLVKMVEPYPVLRYYSPEALRQDWRAQANH